MFRESITGLGAAGLLAAALAIPAASPAFAATAADNSVASVHETSLSCPSPAGAKANYSWGDGTVTTTIYYNNHCSQPLKVFVNFDSYSVCWTTPTGKSSSVTAAGVKSITKRTQNC